MNKYLNFLTIYWYKTEDHSMKYIKDLTNLTDVLVPFDTVFSLNYYDEPEILTI